MPEKEQITAPIIDKGFPPLQLAWQVWGCGAALYVLGFFQRVAPAVMTTELTRDFGLTAVGLGNLSAYYFYSYVAMQIPTGILADRLGPRKLLAGGALMATLGSIVFATAHGEIIAGIGRLLVGGSVAVAFVGMLKLAGHWFAPRQFALASGMALFCGIMGAVFAGVPLRLLVSTLGWRPVMLWASLLTLAVSALIWVVVRDDPAERGYQSHLVHSEGRAGSSSIWDELMEVLRYRNTWLLILSPGGIVGSVLTFSGLWGIPFLTTHYAMAPTTSAALTSALMVAWAIGGPLLGGMSDRIGRRKVLYAASNFIAVAAWAPIIFIPGLPVGILTALLLVAGFASGGMIIGFAFAKESVPARLSGTVSGAVNMGVMVGPMILQPAVGWILDRNWSGITAGGAQLYGWNAYRAGFALMLAWALAACLLILLTRETYCRQRQ
ncbi:MAG: MFS transporter [Desulfuromonadaceae bacterium]|nr:MFS transporter [Desulfuromonadaceae bacterium]